MDILSHLSFLPLVIDYSQSTGNMSQKDEDNLRLGLQQHGRLRRIVLQAPSSSLGTWLEPMNEPFPRLWDLSLSSTSVEEMNPRFLETLQAPVLRRLSLHGISLSAGLPLPSSAITLSTLSLTRIGVSSCFPPGHLATQLQCLSHLEELSIDFTFSKSLLGSKGDLLLSPTPPVTLSTLKRLIFGGEDVYLDNLVAQINIPLLEQLTLTLLFDFTYTIVNLAEFIHRAEGFQCIVAKVIFNKDTVSITSDAGGYDQRGIGKLSLRVNCKPFDWKIDTATQVCNALKKVFSAVEMLTLELDVDGMPSDWENTLDSTGMVWHDLLLPFIGVKKLHIGSSLAIELSKALESVAGGLILELLPELQETRVQLMTDDTKKLFSRFIKTRESIGRPVHLIGPRPHFNRDPVAEVRSFSSPASSTSSLAPSPGPSTPPPLPNVAFSSPAHSPNLSYHSPPHPLVYTPSPIPQPHPLPYIPPAPLVLGVYIHPALFSPSLLYDMRSHPSRSNLRLSPAILATPASSPPLPSLALRVGDLPWVFTVWPNFRPLPGNAVVTIQDVLLTIYFHLRTAVKGTEYEAMRKSEKAEIFEAFERRVGTDPVQRGKELQRVDFLCGRFLAQGLVRSWSTDSVWDVVITR